MAVVSCARIQPLLAAVTPRSRYLKKVLRPWTRSGFLALVTATFIAGCTEAFSPDSEASIVMTSLPIDIRDAIKRAFEAGRKHQRAGHRREEMANKLRDLVAPGKLASVMSAHNPLSARLAELAGFDGVWASGCLRRWWPISTPAMATPSMSCMSSAPMPAPG